MHFIPYYLVVALQGGSALQVDSDIRILSEYILAVCGVSVKVDGSERSCMDEYGPVTVGFQVSGLIACAGLHITGVGQLFWVRDMQ